MSLLAAVVGVAFVGVAVLSAREKARQRDREIAVITGMEPPDARSTPLSQGMVDIVAVAGGVYLSLTMVAGFVGYETPGKVNFLGGQVDPMAVLAVLLALVEPFLSKLFEKRAT